VKQKGQLPPFAPGVLSLAKTSGAAVLPMFRFE
jgi:hypothetical protein